MVVGLPSGGTDGGTVGTAFTDAQDKSKSIAHDHPGPSHWHNLGFQFSGGSSINYNSTPPYGTDGTFSQTHILLTDAADAASGRPNHKTSDDGTGDTGAMSDNTSVATADILAYIQLMTIKKD
jgi:hypothetical protein